MVKTSRTIIFLPLVTIIELVQFHSLQCPKAWRVQLTLELLDSKIWLP